MGEGLYLAESAATQSVLLLPTVCTVVIVQYSAYFCAQILMNVWSSPLVMAMLNVPTQLGPSLVPAMKDTVEME